MRSVPDNAMAARVGASGHASVAPSDTAPASTLLWIGPRRHPEFAGVYRACESLAPQLAYRTTIEEACGRPAQCVGHILLARPERSAAPTSALEELETMYPHAERACLLSSGCEGEARTGTPWPGYRRVYWHRWRQELADWFIGGRGEPCGATGEPEATHPYLVIVAASRPQAEPLLNVASEHAWAATWITPGRTLLVRSATHVLWDDSAAGPATRAVWQRRLGSLSDRRWRADETPPLRHAWLAGFPRLQGWREAQAAGVECLLSKPASSSCLVRFVSDGPLGGSTGRSASF